jgi:hypothetical protein
VASFELLSLQSGSVNANPISIPEDHELGDAESAAGGEQSN